MYIALISRSCIIKQIMNQIELMTKLYNSPTFVKQTLSKINITKTNNYEIPSAALSTNIGKINILIAWVHWII